MAEVEMTIRLDAALRASFLGAARTDLRSGEDVLCELNAIEQVINVAQTTVVQDAWQRGQSLTLHGWVYGLKDGLLVDLQMTISGNEGLQAVYTNAIDAVGRTKRVA